MALWQVESAAGGAVFARYTNLPMNNFCAQGTQEVGELVPDALAHPAIAMRARP